MGARELSLDSKMATGSLSISDSDIESIMAIGAYKRGVIDKGKELLRRVESQLSKYLRR